MSIESSNKTTAGGLNSLRAAILGANDGIISVATTLIAIMGVFGFREIAITGIAVLLAGSLSMAAGEYVSVSAQVNNTSDNDGHSITCEHRDNCLPIIQCNVKEEAVLGRGAALQAAIASFFAFLVGGLFPVLAAVLTHSTIAVIVSALVLLVVTGYISSDKDDRVRSTTRLALVGALAFSVSYIGNLALTWVGV